MQALFKKLIRDENGQSLVLVALLLVVLMGIIALVIDLGLMQSAKAKMQNAADAAALAGAQDLPNIAKAINTAENFARLNGVSDGNITATTPYKDDPAMIKVVCTKNVPYSFARILEFTSVNVSAQAVAYKTSWTGEALPFINLDDKYETEGSILQGWNKVTPGDKERIHDDDLIISPDRTSVRVNYEDGIIFKKGKDASIKDVVDNICKEGKTVYLFSLSNDVISSEKYVDDKLKNKQVIPLEDIVLLECVVEEYDSKLLTLKFVKVHNISSGDLPPGDPPKLIE